MADVFVDPMLGTMDVSPSHKFLLYDKWAEIDPRWRAVLTNPQITQNFPTAFIRSGYRSKQPPGPGAAPEGLSYHQTTRNGRPLGAAVDINGLSIPELRTLNESIQRIAKELGYPAPTWGGTWKTPYDPVHWQWSDRGKDRPGVRGQGLSVLAANTNSKTPLTQNQIQSAIAGGGSIECGPACQQAKMATLSGGIMNGNDNTMAAAPPGYPGGPVRPAAVPSYMKQDIGVPDITTGKSEAGKPGWLLAGSALERIGAGLMMTSVDPNMRQLGANLLKMSSSEKQDEMEMRQRQLAEAAAALGKMPGQQVPEALYNMLSPAMKMAVQANMGRAPGLTSDQEMASRMAEYTARAGLQAQQAQEAFNRTAALRRELAGRGEAHDYAMSERRLQNALAEIEARAKYQKPAEQKPIDPRVNKLLSLDQQSFEPVFDANDQYEILSVPANQQMNKLQEIKKRKNTTTPQAPDSFGWK